MFICTNSFTGEQDICENDFFGEKPPFEGILQLHIEKKATALTANATILSSVHIALLNFTTEYRICLVNHRHALAGVLLDFTCKNISKSD